MLHYIRFKEAQDPRLMGHLPMTGYVLWNLIEPQPNSVLLCNRAV